MPRPSKKSVLAALSLEQQLAHHVTQWDIRQSRSRYHNPFALGIYLERAERVANEVAAGECLSVALARNFNDRLLAFLQRQFSAEQQIGRAHV